MTMPSRLIIKHLDEIEELEDPMLLQSEVLFALVFLAVLLVRFMLMRFTTPSVLPGDTPRRIKLMATAVHLGMYLSLSMIAVTGLFIAWLFAEGAQNSLAMDLALFTHEFFVFVSYSLIAIHIAGALYHRRLKDGVWDAMMPTMTRQ